MEGKRTGNIVRTVMERATEIRKDVYMCFIDFEKKKDIRRHKYRWEGFTTDCEPTRQAVSSGDYLK